MKEFLLTLIFLTGSFASALAQNLERITWYGPASDGIVKEIFQSSGGDSVNKSGRYQLYDQNGNLVEEGFYEKNLKKGWWVYPNSQCKALGISFYRGDTLLMGVQRDSVVGDSLRFVSGTEVLASNPVTQKQWTDSLWDQVFLGDTSHFKFLGCPTSNIAQRMAALNQQTQEAALPVSMPTLISDLMDLVVRSRMFKTQFAIVDQIGLKLKSVYKPSDAELYAQYMLPVEEDIQAFEKADSLNNRQNLVRKIQLRYLVTAPGFDELLILRRKIKEKYPVVRENYKNTFVNIFQKELSKTGLAYEEFMKPGELQNRIDLGKSLQTQLDSLDIRYVKLKKIDEDVAKRFPLIKANYRDNYQNLYVNDFKNVEQKVNDYENISSSSIKFDEGRNLVILLDTLDSFFNQFRIIDEAVNRRLNDVKDKYLKTYINIYKKDIKPLEADKVNYDIEGNLEKKLVAGRSVIQRIGLMETGFDTIQVLDKKIREGFPVIKANYCGGFKDICRREIEPLQAQVGEFDNIGSLNDKITQGKHLDQRIQWYLAKYQEIKVLTDSIEIRFPALKAGFKESFADIYKTRVKTLEANIEIYRRIELVESKITQANKILEELKLLEGSFTDLSAQTQLIDERLKQVEGDYQNTFPVIYKTEIRELRVKFREYEKVDDISRKLGVGNIILSRLENLEKNLPVLKELDASIQSEFPRVRDSFKGKFPVLYKSEVVPLEARKSEYEGMGTLTPKLNSGNLVLSKTRDLAAKHVKLTEQVALLESKYQEFQELYKKRKEVKNLFKKGKKAYEFYYKAFNDEPTIDKKPLVGEELELILRKLINISSRDNSLLENEVRKTKTPQEFKRALGL